MPPLLPMFILAMTAGALHVQHRSCFPFLLHDGPQHRCSSRGPDLLGNYWGQMRLARARRRLGFNWQGMTTPKHRGAALCTTTAVSRRQACMQCSKAAYSHSSQAAHATLDDA